MDMIFKRYSSPFIFLDSLIENNQLNDYIIFLYKQQQEEKWWELYLATLPLNDKSFEDWKKESSKGSYSYSNNVDIEISKSDVDTIIKNSQNILSGFKPPQ